MIFFRTHLFLIQFEPIWSNLIRLFPIWTNFIWFELNYQLIQFEAILSDLNFQKWDNNNKTWQRLSNFKQDCLSLKMKEQSVSSHFVWRYSFSQLSIRNLGYLLSTAKRKKATQKWNFVSKIVQCNLDLVTLLDSSKTVTKSHVVTKLNDFM